MFPFVYEGVKYDKCTSTHAAEGAVWCATQVHANGTVIEGRWGDCTEGCPGARKYLIRGIRTKKGSHIGLYCSASSCYYYNDENPRKFFFSNFLTAMEFGVLKFLTENNYDKMAQKILVLHFYFTAQHRNFLSTTLLLKKSLFDT